MFFRDTEVNLTNLLSQHAIVSTKANKRFGKITRPSIRTNWIGGR